MSVGVTTDQKQTNKREMAKKWYFDWRK